MGAINIGAKNGGRVKVVAPDNPVEGTEAILPKESGTLARLEDIGRLLDLDVDELRELGQQVEKNKQDIVELEEEIEALAPSFDRGDWDYKEPTNPAAMPEEGTYFLLDDSENITTEFANTNEILFNNKDVHEINHTWSTVEVGQSIELFDSVDKDYLLAKIEEITLESGAVKLEVTVQQSEGGVVGDSSRVRVKIFEIPEVDISTLMPKSGGTFTGNVTTDKGGIYINTSNKNTGNNFSVTNGNSVKQW